MKRNYVILVTIILSGYWMTLSPQNLPRSGELVITEIMANPEAVSDANGEWIEIFNPTNQRLLLNGLIIKDAGSNKHSIASTPLLVIEPRTYWVLAKNKDTLVNGGVRANYQYASFTLGNTLDQVILCLPDETVIDQVSYGDGWPVVSGASMELHPDYMNSGANDDPVKWYPARIPFGAGDKGSPGNPNPVSAASHPKVLLSEVDIFPNPTSGRFMLEARFPSCLSGAIRLTSLIGQEFTYKYFENKLSLREVIEADFLSPGIWFVRVLAGKEMITTRLIVE